MPSSPSTSPAPLRATATARLPLLLFLLLLLQPQSLPSSHHGDAFVLAFRVVEDAVRTTTRSISTETTSSFDAIVASGSSGRRTAVPAAIAMPAFGKKSPTLTSLFMFGGLFGGDGTTLALIDDVVAVADDVDVDAKYNSLVDYVVNKWSQLLVDDPKRMKLTTPVVAVPSPSPSAAEGGDDDGGITVLASKGVQLVFQNIDTGYKSRKEEEEEEEERGKEQKKQKKPKKEGGVEIVVEKVQKGETKSIRVTARRCNVDDDTVLKEMSEDAIVKELRKAIGVWKDL